MPEIPDVETFRRFLNRTAIGKTIEKIDVRDKMILRGLSARTLQAQVRGKEVRLKGPSWEVRVCLASSWRQAFMRADQRTFTPVGFVVSGIRW